MKLYVLVVCYLVTSGLAYSTQARPVSYPGGWTTMQMNDMDTHSLHIHYSPTAKYSVGYKTQYWRDKNWQFHGVQLNYLAKRWNQPNSQANFYIKSGAGIANGSSKASNNQNEAALFTGIALDWEDRRYFTSYENTMFDAGDIDQFFTQKARIGVAPYIGNYGDIHTWLMLQADHNPKAKEPLTLTPLVRIFKDEYLTETGINHHGDVMFNFIIRF